ncbi:peptidoglycan-associated lipoprotein [Geomonas limicola]|uniref:Peptidoglycan-associated protein n=1 Tax=Geomonas limicola TaxID=2740186 RepID=A0A6V8NAT7_9BACT|nr:OmpA family protein [Geomonas limicola]GFO69560.1 peptidoglycan-associated lipoprotein [Geomonas limicola]
MTFTKSVLLGLAATALCAGCAKQEVVKHDQMIPTTPAATQPASTPKSAAPAPVAKAPAEERLPDTSIKEAQPTPAKAAELKNDQGTVQNLLEKVFFDFDSSALSTAARTSLAKNAEVLKKSNLKIRIEGNCDELGSDDYNLSLGESRAASALKYLKALGVPAERMSIISYGKEKPAVGGHDDAARAQNRRDEFVVVSK